MKRSSVTASPRYCGVHDLDRHPLAQRRGARASTTSPMPPSLTDRSTRYLLSNTPCSSRRLAGQAIGSSSCGGCDGDMARAANRHLATSRYAPARSRAREPRFGKPLVPARASAPAPSQPSGVTPRPPRPVAKPRSARREPTRGNLRYRAGVPVLACWTAPRSLRTTARWLPATLALLLATAPTIGRADTLQIDLQANPERGFQVVQELSYEAIVAGTDGYRADLRLRVALHNASNREQDAVLSLALPRGAEIHGLQVARDGVWSRARPPASPPSPDAASPAPFLFAHSPRSPTAICPVPRSSLSASNLPPPPRSSSSSRCRCACAATAGSSSCRPR